MSRPTATATATDALDGRSPAQVLAEAEAFGVDLSLVRAQLTRTPEERLLALDENLAFLQKLHRGYARLQGMAPRW